MLKEQSLQDSYLTFLCEKKIPVSVFLHNGVKLRGRIESFDQHVILLENIRSEENHQMVYKQGIATIVPASINGSTSEQDEVAKKNE